MQFVETELPGAFLVKPQPHLDERGLFARTWCELEFAEHGIRMSVRQCNISVNRRRGTLRGLHYQAAPYHEAKTVTCVRGAIHDVIVDLRSTSPTFKRYVAVELTAENRHMLYIPPGLAHGYQTLMDDSEVYYQMSELYVPEMARGVRWNDPAFGIAWPPVEQRIMSPLDRDHPDFKG